MRLAAWQGYAPGKYRLVFEADDGQLFDKFIISKKQAAGDECDEEEALGLAMSALAMMTEAERDHASGWRFNG